MIDRIVSSVPVNKVAAVVVSPGTRYDDSKFLEFVRSNGQGFSDRPFPMRRTKTPDLGRRYGRLVLIGRLAEKDQGGDPLFVMRCDCGNYTYHRKWKLRRKKHLMCPWCFWQMDLRDRGSRALNRSKGRQRRYKLWRDHMLADGFTQDEISEMRENPLYTDELVAELTRMRANDVNRSPGG